MVSRGWKKLIYETIKANFANRMFSLQDLYAFERNFYQVYASNFHVKEKIRQVLQQLRDEGYIKFLDNQGTYVLNQTMKVELIVEEQEDHLVYLLSNQSIPDWVKIGRTNNIERRLKELYNTSIPTPFKLEESILTQSKEKAIIVESTIHTLIDTLNSSLRKDTESYRREFFKLSPEKGIEVFHLASRLININ
jgi:hypothetical protein